MINIVEFSKYSWPSDPNVFIRQLEGLLEIYLINRTIDIELNFICNVNIYLRIKSCSVEVYGVI